MSKVFLTCLGCVAVLSAAVCCSCHAACIGTGTLQRLPNSCSCSTAARVLLARRDVCTRGYKQRPRMSNAHVDKRHALSMHGCLHM